MSFLLLHSDASFTWNQADGQHRPEGMFKTNK